MIDYLGSTDDVRPFIADADCVVLPSYREGTPRTLLEAAAMGKPLIATDVPGCRNVVEHGRNGFLCRVRDAEDLGHTNADVPVSASRHASRRWAGEAGRRSSRSSTNGWWSDRYLETLADIGMRRQAQVTASA